MPFTAAIVSAARSARRPQGFSNQDLFVPSNSSSSAARNPRRFQGGHGASLEETTPLNSNRNDFEDIENPFRISSEVSKRDQSCCQITLVVLMMALFIFGAVCFILSWNGVHCKCSYSNYSHSIIKTNQNYAQLLIK